MKNTIGLFLKTDIYFNFWLSTKSFLSFFNSSIILLVILPTFLSVTFFLSNFFRNLWTGNVSIAEHKRCLSKSFNCKNKAWKLHPWRHQHNKILRFLLCIRSSDLCQTTLQKTTLKFLSYKIGTRLSHFPHLIFLHLYAKISSGMFLW